MTTVERALPRSLAPGIFWLGDCLELPHEGEVLHAYHSAFLVAGDDASLLVDTGHAKDWRVIRRQIEQLLDAGLPPVSHVFPTHI